MKNNKIKILIIVALFSFSGIYLFFTVMHPGTVSSNSILKSHRTIANNENKEAKSNNISQTSESKGIVYNIENPFLSSKYLYNFAFTKKTSLSIIPPPRDAIRLSEIYFVGTFYNQDTKSLNIVVNKDGKDIYINEGDIINERYGKLKLMKVYINFLLFMDKDGKKYYIQK